MFSRTTLWPLAAFAVLAATAHTAPAAIITGFSLPSGLTIPVNTPAPNNNNTVTASPSVIDLPVAPGTALVFADTNPITTTFTAQPSAGSTEYFIRETVLNNSAVAWSGYSIQLNTSGPIVFVPPALFDVPSLDPIPTASIFTSLSPTVSELRWSGGVVPAGGTLNLKFSIDVPDLTTNPPLTIYTFPMNQAVFAVPEPSTWMLQVVAAPASAIAARGIFARKNYSAF